MIVINTGATANDGTGDKLRDAFIIVNQNFLDIQDILDVVLTDSSIIPISQISGLQTILDDLSYQVSLIPGLQDDINSINSTIFTINQTLNSQNSSINELYSLVNDLQQQIFTKIGDAPIDGQQYVRQDGDWVISTGGLTPGPTGPQGIQGPTGPQGATGTSLLQNVTPNVYQGLRLQPASASNNGFYINKSVNGSVGYYARNTDNTGNGAISAYYVGGTGSDIEQNISSFFAANNGYYVPYLRNKSGIYTDRGEFFFVGAAGSSFNFVTGTGSYGTETSKFKITNSGTVSIGVQPTLDNTTTDILGRKADGTIVRIDKSSIGLTGSYLPLAGGTMDVDADIFFTNGSKLSEGLIDAQTGGNKGIALTCAVGYEFKWEGGELYITNPPFNFISLKFYARTVPQPTDDSTKGFGFYSRWVTLEGNTYRCNDATPGAAVWDELLETLQNVTDNGSTTTNSITADGGFFTNWDLGSFQASPNRFEYSKAQIVDDEDRSVSINTNPENGFQTLFVSVTPANQLQSYIIQKNDVTLGINQTVDDVFISNYLTITTTETLTPKKIVTFEGFEGEYVKFSLSNKYKYINPGTYTNGITFSNFNLPDKVDGTYTLATTVDIPLRTSQLVNDGDNGTSHFISLEDLPSTLTLYPTTATSSIGGYNRLVTSITDPIYNTTAVDVSTGAITGTDQFIAGLITDPNVIIGNPGIFNMTTIGNIRKTAGSGQAEFFFRVYKRDAGGTETLILQSSDTPPIDSAIYTEFNASGLWNDGIFVSTDRIVLKFYGTKVGGGSNPTYNFQFGGAQPVRSIVPVPLNVIPVITLNELTDVTITGTPSNNSLLAYGTSSFWENRNLIDILETFNRTQGIYYFEDFMGSQGGGVSTSFGSVTSAQSGAGANSTNISGATILNRTNQQGVNRAQTGTTTTGQAGFVYSNQGLFRGTGAITLETYTTVETLSTLLERFYNYFGYLGIGQAVSPNNGIFFAYDEGGLLGFGVSAPSPNWKCVTINTSVRTFTITSIPVVAGQWYKLRIVVNAAGNSIQFFIDNVLVATHTTNIPANTLGLTTGNFITKATGTTARAMLTDYFMYKETFTNPR